MDFSLAKKNFLLLVIFFSAYFSEINSVSAQSTQSVKIKPRRAQAVRQDVEIYQQSSFDSEIISTINPGKYYLISKKTYGPFYKIKLSEKVIGYVADTELDIEGIGPLKEKAFLDDQDLDQKQIANTKINKNDQARIKEIEEDSESEDPDAKTNYHGFILGLVNYHEKTMSQTQIADLYSFGYRYIPYLSDFAASVSWDANINFGLPAYYKDKLNASGSGVTLWLGTQLVNISPLDSKKTIRYGLGPFIKYSNYSVSVPNKVYTLQDITIGFLVEGGFIYHLGPVGIDFGLRYYWDKAPYGGLSLGFLF